MMCQMIWYFVLLLCVLVKSDGIGRFHAQNQTNFLLTENGKSTNSFTAKSSDERTKETKIIKRGIVLVDEDFDVPSAIYAHENNSGTGVNLNTDIFERNDGSGNDEFGEKELVNTTEQTFIHSPNTKGGDDVLDEKEFANTTIQTSFTNSSSTKASTSMQPTKVKLTETTDGDMSSTDLESSGDEILSTTKEYEVTETTTLEITLVHKEIPDICTNSTCSQDDLFVSLSESKNIMPEGTNVSLLCKSNNSDYNMLYWYKSNGTEYFLQSFGTSRELLFNIPDTKSVHSGMYQCVKWINTETCCNLKLSFSVYEMPLYRYHLIILGLIVGSGILICIFLSIRQTITLRSYTKQFVEKHGMFNQQLL